MYLTLLLSSVDILISIGFPLESIKCPSSGTTSPLITFIFFAYCVILISFINSS